MQEHIGPVASRCLDTNSPRGKTADKQLVADRLTTRVEYNVVKTLILAGGYGSRLAEETEVRPKPMVEIGGQPILWHIMKIVQRVRLRRFRHRPRVQG